MMPFAFAAWTLKSVGEAANEMVKECTRQFLSMVMGPTMPYTFAAWILKSVGEAAN